MVARQTAQGVGEVTDATTKLPEQVLRLSINIFGQESSKRYSIVMRKLPLITSMGIMGRRLLANG